MFISQLSTAVNLLFVVRELELATVDDYELHSLIFLTTFDWMFFLDFEIYSENVSYEVDNNQLLQFTIDKKRLMVFQTGPAKMQCSQRFCLR